jgi:hypothetical protein
MLDKLGSRLTSALKGHGADEIDWGFMRLPPGINMGVARLIQSGFDKVKPGKQNAGEFYWLARGVVEEPEYVEHKGQRIKVRGMQTGIIRMLCQTTDSNGKVTSLDENALDAVNEMRKLGGEFSENPTGAEMVAVAAALEATAKPGGTPIYFNFSTSESSGTKLNPRTGKPFDPRTFENWHGIQKMDPSYQPPGPGAAFKDSTSVNGQPAVSGPAEEALPAEPDVDVDALVAAAKQKDATAQEQLQALAREREVDEDWLLADETSWEEVGEFIKNPDGAAAEERAAEEEKKEPAIGEIWYWQERDAKGNVKKGPKGPVKAVEIDIKKIANKKADGINNLTKKPVKGIPVDQLMATAEG